MGSFSLRFDRKEKRRQGANDRGLQFQIRGPSGNVQETLGNRNHVWLFEDPWVPNGRHSHHRSRQDREGDVRPGDRFLLGISNGGYPGSDTGDRGQNSREKS